MRIFHTADWHIGKLVHKLYMTEDQAYILDELISIISMEKPDVLIIAGDVYDRSIPPASAVELLDRFFTRVITETETKVLVISGNHDSPDRLKFGSSILEKQGLYIATQVEDCFRPVVLKDGFGKVHFYMIPFLEPEIVRDYFDDESIKSHDDAMKKVIDALEIDSEGRNVCISHGYITAGDALLESDSEKPLSIGGSSFVSSTYLDAFDYVALGHLHGPQRVGKERMRYSGSLMKYSFSEATQRKGIQVIELSAKGDLDMSEISLVPRRDFRVIKGSMEQLLDQKIYTSANTQDYIKAILTDQGELINAFSKLKAVYPNILSVEFEKIATLEQGAYDLDSQMVAQKEPEELFRDFYEWVEQDELTDQALEVFSEVSNAVLKMGRDA